VELDDVLAALAAVQKQLSALPADAWGERYQLQVEQDRLRSEADVIRRQHNPHEGRTDDELTAEVASLERRMKAMVARTGGIVTSKGGGNQSPGSGAMASLEIKGKQQQAVEIARLASRVNEIEMELERRLSG
jgi:hypothetical protein